MTLKSFAEQNAVSTCTSGRLFTAIVGRYAGKEISGSCGGLLSRKGLKAGQIDKEKIISKSNRSGDVGSDWKVK